ncbi:tyrosine-type recombinase/integrase [Weissella cibaria]|uniref:tyrosine-type recombinase/integrase n=1 Tax=Weissella cibaria TaxID=137591 RepID=UPI00118F1AF9|nr:site-specific integrase [Weissella cibaria]TVV32475.1 site-specific integrase [Weissella cibaria]
MSIKKQKDGTYSVRISWTDNQGKRREKNKKGLANLTLAKHWERQTLLDAEAGKFETVNTYTTTNQLVEMWLKEYSRNKRDVTVSKVRRFFDMYVLVPEWFNNLEISNISRKDVQRWTDWLASIHATYKKQATYFSKVFDVAVSYELLEANPFNSIRYPTAIAKPDRSYRVEAYDRGQLEAFIQALLDKYDNNAQYHKYAYLRLLAFTGMRNGEARALEWSDVHLDGPEPYIDVNKTMSDVTGKGVVINAPKTKAGNRTVKLDPITTQVLRRWRVIQGQRLMRRGLPSNVVWTNQRLSGRISSNQPREWLLSAIKGTNVPQINVHGLRHTYITLAVEANVPIKALQAQVGHDDINTTLGVYAAVTKDMRAKTTELFTALVNF